MNEWCKCNFCNNTSWDGCDWCSNYSEYKPDSDAIIQMSKSKGVSVADVIKLIEYCGD